MDDDFISAPEAEARFPGRRRSGAAYFVDDDANRWNVVRSPGEGSFEKVEGYRRRGLRVSTDKNDPGYHATAAQFEVRLDGRRIDNWVTADTEEGRVVINAFKGGQIVFAENDETRALTFEETRGAVTVERA